jgi:hypothetical protein
MHFIQGYVEFNEGFQIGEYINYCSKACGYLEMSLLLKAFFLSIKKNKKINKQ